MIFLPENWAQDGLLVELQFGAYCFQISIPRIWDRTSFDGVSSVVKAFDITEFETYLSNINQLETTSNVYPSFWLA